ncbi:MAG: nickel-dependent hydrogenase large subunit, partial [Bacteroidetes bacterium]|nr:nickel-dependent hydrogenase large subunit [Bacteroidota bacterium]
IAIETVRLTSSFTFPEFEQDYEFVALKHPEEYPFNEGKLVSNKGLNINVNEYEKYFHEEHVRHSNALQSAKSNDEIYFVGPLARYNLNFDKLPDSIKELAKEVNMLPPCNNPFKSITVRAIETLYACQEALRIIEQFEMPEKQFVDVQPREGTGYGCTEAPRGILYHKYRMDANGIIQEAKIVPPTSQNQKQIENDLFSFVSKNINLPTDELTWKCEQTVRNYDPCISCATHFLKLNFVRE